MAATVTSMAAASPTTTVASTTTTPAATAAGTASAAARTISAAIAGAGRLRSIDAIEVRFIAFFKVSAAFEGQASGDRRGNCNGFDWSSVFAAFAAIRWSTATHLCALLLQDRFARESNASALDRQHFHQHLIAFFQLVTNIFNAMLGDFADVEQTFGAGDDFDECAKVGQPRDFAEIGLPYFGGCSQVADDLQGFVGGSFVVRSHVDLARIFHVDLHAGLLDDRANHFAAGPNHVADLIDRDLQGVNSRSERRNFLAMGGDDFVHLAKNEHAAALRLGESFAHDLRSNAADLDVHL